MAPADDEEWRAVLSHPLYEVSNHGRVRSTPRGRNTGRILKQAIDRDGYCKVTLFDGADNRKRVSVHHLVLEAFVGPRFGALQCAHLDGNPQNNTPANLAWVTCVENARQRVVHGTQVRGSSHPLAKLSAEKAVWIRENYRVIPTKTMAKMLGVDQAAIWKVGTGRGWK
jgi:hypothetical protein